MANVADRPIFAIGPSNLRALKLSFVMRAKRTSRPGNSGGDRFLRGIGCLVWTEHFDGVMRGG